MLAGRMRGGVFLVARGVNVTTRATLTKERNPWRAWCLVALAVVMLEYGYLTLHVRNVTAPMGGHP
jgi:hypothetical protein